MEKGRALQWLRSGLAAPATVGQALKIAALRALILTAGLVSIALLAGVGQAREIEFVPKPGQGNTGYSMEQDLFRLVNEYDCWTDQSDHNARLYPSHVLYFDKASERPVLGDLVVTEKALEQVYSGEDHGLVLFAFCA